MADLRISDLNDGASLQVTDMVLVLRTNATVTGSTTTVSTSNVHLKGSLLAAGIDYRPPDPAVFPTGSLAFAPATRGTQVTGGAALATAFRPIPSASSGAFSLVTNINFNAASHGGAIFGPAVATADGSGIGYIGRGWKIGSLAMHGPAGGYVTGSGTAWFPYDLGSECPWFRITVSGQTATFAFSDNGVVWCTLATQTFAAPVTQYGYAMRNAGSGVPLGRISYFDSSEFPNDRF